MLCDSLDEEGEALRMHLVKSLNKDLKLLVSMIWMICPRDISFDGVTLNLVGQPKTFSESKSVRQKE